jgi:hypothetical protein
MANSIPCVTTGLARGIDINYTGLTVVSGDTVYASGSDGKGGTISGCYEITGDSVSTVIVALSVYSDCYDCLNQNYGVVNFASCDGNFEALQAPISSFGVVPFSDQVFYGTFDVNAGEGNILERITSCWIVDRKNPVVQYRESAYANLYLSTAVTVPTSQTSCESCLSANSVTYEVSRCIEGTLDYVLLIGNQYIGNTISYTDGINQFCGIVERQVVGSPELTFVFDYGEGDRCTNCLTESNQKTLIESCTDSRTQYTVWSSTLFNVGDYTHLSTDDGCFRIIGPSEDEIDNINFLNFVPSPGCDPCIECNGIAYQYTTCGDEPISGVVYLYQNLPVGTTFYDPQNGTCSTIDGITTGEEYRLYGTPTFVDCDACTGDTKTYEIWEADICFSTSTRSVYVITTSVAGLSGGETVKLMWGSNEYICATLTTISTPGSGNPYYNTKVDSSGYSVIYDGCNTCTANSYISVGLVHCDTGVESYVTISLENYIQITGGVGTLPNYTIRDINQNCYTVTSACPLPASESTGNLSIVYFFYSCIYCPDQIITSANTETDICQQICTDTGSTVVSVDAPHPIYTDGYNNPIMQLNMIVLGGINGLNN